MAPNSGSSLEIGRIVLVLVVVLVLDFFDPTPSAGQIENDDDEDDKTPPSHLPANRSHTRPRLPLDITVC